MKTAPCMWILFVLIAGAGGARPGATAGPGTAEATSAQVFRSAVELVALNVVVTDDRLRFVPNLQNRDFVVLEDGVPQDISFFADGQVPLDLIILIDTSSSMSATRAMAHKAATGFLQVLRPEDRGAVVGFNHGVSVLQDLSNDVPALQAAVGLAGTNGTTSLYTAVYIALKQFGRPALQANQVRRQAIVALTDGEENTSGLAFDDLLGEARSRGVAVYAIMLQCESLAERERIEGRLMPSRRAMKELARETGALAYFPKRGTDLQGVYATIAAELTSQYSMAYVPRNAGHGSALRQIAIRVASRPGLRTRARTAYLSSGPALRLAALR